MVMPLRNGGLNGPLGPGHSERHYTRPGDLARAITTTAAMESAKRINVHQALFTEGCDGQINASLMNGAVCCTGCPPGSGSDGIALGLAGVPGVVAVFNGVPVKLTLGAGRPKSSSSSKIEAHTIPMVNPGVPSTRGLMNSVGNVWNFDGSIRAVGYAGWSPPDPNPFPASMIAARVAPWGGCYEDGIYALGANVPFDTNLTAGITLTCGPNGYSRDITVGAGEADVDGAIGFFTMDSITWYDTGAAPHLLLSYGAPATRGTCVMTRGGNIRSSQYVFSIEAPLFTTYGTASAPVHYSTLTIGNYGLMVRAYGPEFPPLAWLSMAEFFPGGSATPPPYLPGDSSNRPLFICASLDGTVFVSSGGGRPFNASGVDEGRVVQFRYIAGRGIEKVRAIQLSLVDAYVPVGADIGPLVAVA